MRSYLNIIPIFFSLFNAIFSILHTEFLVKMLNSPWLVIGYWHWIKRPIIFKLHGNINGGYLEENHQLGDLGREDSKRVREKERKVGRIKLANQEQEWFWESVRFWISDEGGTLLTCTIFMNDWWAMQTYHVISCYENCFSCQ